MGEHVVGRWTMGGVMVGPRGQVLVAPCRSCCGGVKGMGRRPGAVVQPGGERLGRGPRHVQHVLAVALPPHRRPLLGCWRQRQWRRRLLVLLLQCCWLAR